MMEIAGRKIGNEYPPYVIAEISANHNGDINKALELITLAKEVGADAVKIQTYTADTMTLDCDKKDFKISGGLWDGYSLYQLYQEAHTPWDWHPKLFEHAKNMGIPIFSSPFDESAVDFLESLNVPAYKVASFELVDLPLIEYMASKMKPIIMSTGMANLTEIKDALAAVRKYHDQVCVLHCVSGYPTPVEQSNLNTIQDLAKKLNVPVGLSDHTLSTTTAVVSIGLGARVIEKHFIRSRSDGGPDSAFSHEPSEFKRLCADVKTAFEALGAAGYERKAAEEPNLKFRRSIYVVKDIKAGETITTENIKRIRPGFGLAPKMYPDVLGKKVKKDLFRGEPLCVESLDI